MPALDSKRLAEADLTLGERRTVERFISLLADNLGGDLQALWLYGSRARGEARADSDIDLLVIADGGRDQHRWTAGDLSEKAALTEGESPFAFSIHIQDPRWLKERRQIDSFFIRQVDQDEIVLAGSDLR